MDIETRLARLESGNRRLRIMACVAVCSALCLLLGHLATSTTSIAMAQDAKRAAPKPVELKVTKLILVDSKGKERVTLAADEDAAAPNAPVFSVLDTTGKVLARIGDTNDAGPSIQFFVDGKRTASYSHMNLSLRSPKSEVDRLYLGLLIAADPTAGEVVSPSLDFKSKAGKQVVALHATDEKGGRLRLFDEEDKLVFEKP